MVKSALNLFKKNKRGVITSLFCLILFYFGLPYVKELIKKKNSGYSDLSEKDKEYFLAAQTIANSLGVTKKWYQASFYFEDEKNVIAVLKQYKRNFKAVENYYYKITKNLLMNDLQQYLNVEQFNEFKNVLI